MTIWAFQAPTEGAERRAIYDSLKNEGKSRFGWSTDDANDLTLERNHWTDANNEQMFLLKIGQGDWIVHVNIPEHNLCAAAPVLSGYNFDDGLRFPDRADFRHCFEIDRSQLVEFNRRDPAVVPRVNLDLRRRFHRVKATDDFHRTLNNLRTGETANLWFETEPTLDVLTELIHEYNKSKQLETFLAPIFEKMPGVVKVQHHGARWGTDHGADLIIEYGKAPLPRFTVVVQVKSFQGQHEEVGAVEQIKEAVSTFGAHAGLIVTTGRKTSQLEKRIEAAANELGVQIELLAFRDVARFVIEYAADQLFRPLPD